MNKWYIAENCIIVVGMVALVITGHPWWAAFMVLLINYRPSK